MIESISVPGLADLFNLPSLVEEVIGNIISAGITNVIESSISLFDAQITEAGTDIGI